MRLCFWISFAIFIITLSSCGFDKNYKPEKGRRGSNDISVSEDEGACPVTGGGGGGKIIFVTNSLTGGDMGGGGGAVGGADAICTADANRPADVTPVKALIADGTVRIACTTANCGGGAGEHTDWVLSASTLYTRSDGTEIGTTNAAGIFAFPLTNSWNGASTASFTGLLANWTSDTNTCVAWSSSDVGNLGGAGLNNSTASAAIATDASACSTGRRLVCVGQ